MGFAVLHELAVAVPLRMLRGWAFWGMSLQVSLQLCKSQQQMM
jgi:hypothetical protein